MAETVAAIGIGIMGSKLAARLMAAGHEVRGFDPDPERMDDFVRAGGVPTQSPRDAVAGCQLALLSLLTSEISREVCLGPEGLSASPDRPLLVLDSTTGRPADSVSIAGELAPKGIEYVDMTISGNAAVAERGELVVMLGGSDEAYRTALPIMEAIGRSHHHVGQVGSGARMKLIVNHVLAVNRAGLAEGLVVAEKAGLDLDQAFEILEDSAAYSRAMDLWGRRMVAADHERPNARLRQSHKDARLIIEHARAVGAPMDLMDAARQMMAEGERDGLGEKDNSSAIEVVRRRAGIGRVAHPAPEPGENP